MLKYYKVLIILLFIFPEIAFLENYFPLTRIFTLVILIKFFLSVQVDFQPGENIKLRFLVKKLVIIWFMFISYMLLIDILQNEAFQGIKDYLINLTSFIIFYVTVSHRLEEKADLIHFYLLIAIFPLALGFLQINNGAFSYQYLFPSNPVFFMPISEFTDAYIYETGRISGPYSHAVSYSVFLAFIIIVALTQYIESKKKFYLIIISVCLILTIFTFTRSLIYGIVPSILLGYFFLKREKMRSIVLISILSLLFIALYTFFIIPLLSQLDNRSASIFDSNTAVKLISNIYGVAGTLNESPIWGISKVNHYDVISRGFQIIYVDVLSDFNLVETHHNQLGSYIKYYGLIGLFFILIIHWRVYKIIKLLDKKIALILMIYLIYVFQFSMLHNYYLIDDYLFWFVLGLAVNNKLQEHSA